MSKLLSTEEIGAALVNAPEWQQAGNEIYRSFTLPSFTAALVFAAAVGHLAERADHHPDILIQYKKVTLKLSTHSAGGLTEKDFNLAREIDMITR
ncbi:MAG: 4a-hydroxytetrahydrobiopterin dehydratase [Nitrososphaerales archaeon]